jgi:hypothetical protein
VNEHRLRVNLRPLATMDGQKPRDFPLVRFQLGNQVVTQSVKSSDLPCFDFTLIGVMAGTCYTTSSSLRWRARAVTHVFEASN